MHKRGDAGEAGASDAARLFADRASYVQSRFELSQDVAGAVETIVRRVDGIPLAIELAAARARVLSAEEIASGLDDHLRLLRGGHQSDPRHQTIRASLDWSHELLTEPERQLFARLSVFSGGLDLEAATAVCTGGAIAPGQVLDEVQGLVDKSLLAVERRAGATRFRMLDFVRQYAAERLAAAGEGDLLADRHRAYFRESAGRADRELWALVPASAPVSTMSRPTCEPPSTTAAPVRPMMPGGWSGALGLYWRARGRRAEGVTATERARAPPRLILPPRVLPWPICRFCRSASAISPHAVRRHFRPGNGRGDRRHPLAGPRAQPPRGPGHLGDPGTGDPMLIRAAELARTAGDDVALCNARTSLVISYFCQDDPALRSPLNERSGWRKPSASRTHPLVLVVLAHTALAAGDLAGARAHGERRWPSCPDRTR